MEYELSGLMDVGRSGLDTSHIGAMAQLCLGVASVESQVVGVRTPASPLLVCAKVPDRRSKHPEMEF